MASKADIVKYIRKNFQSRELDDGALALVFPLGEGRSHQVIVDWNNDEGTWTTFLGFVCDWSPNAAAQALEQNDQIFGLAKFGDWIAIQHPQLTETADEEEIDKALIGVALAADALEKKVTGKDEW